MIISLYVVKFQIVHSSHEINVIKSTLLGVLLICFHLDLCTLLFCYVAAFIYVISCIINWIMIACKTCLSKFQLLAISVRTTYV
jgi:hypothetical protein